MKKTLQTKNVETVSIPESQRVNQRQSSTEVSKPEGKKYTAYERRQKIETTRKVLRDKIDQARKTKVAQAFRQQRTVDNKGRVRIKPSEASQLVSKGVTGRYSKESMRTQKDITRSALGIAKGLGVIPSNTRGGTGSVGRPQGPTGKYYIPGKGPVGVYEWRRYQSYIKRMASLQGQNAQVTPDTLVKQLTQNQAANQAMQPQSQVEMENQQMLVELINIQNMHKVKDMERARLLNDKRTYMKQANILGTNMFSKDNLDRIKQDVFSEQGNILQAPNTFQNAQNILNTGRPNILQSQDNFMRTKLRLKFF